MVAPESMLVIRFKDTGFVDIAAHIRCLRLQNIVQAVGGFLGSTHDGRRAVVGIGDFGHCDFRKKRFSMNWLFVLGKFAPGVQEMENRTTKGEKAGEISRTHIYDRTPPCRIHGALIRWYGLNPGAAHKGAL